MFPRTLILCTTVAMALHADPAPNRIAPPWESVVRTVQLLANEEGTVKLFKENPSLADPFADADGFYSMVKTWRGKIMPLPANPADLDEERITIQVGDGANTESLPIYVIFHQDPGGRGALTWLKLTYMTKGLTRVQFWRGFVRETPLRNDWGYLRDRWYPSYQDRR